jgi:hypothetical protein
MYDPLGEKAMTSIILPATCGFTYARAAHELDVSVAAVRALLKSGRLRTADQPPYPPIDPIAVYECVIEAKLWTDTLSSDTERGSLNTRILW